MKQRLGLISMIIVALLLVSVAKPAQAAFTNPTMRPYHHGQIMPSGTGDEGFYLPLSSDTHLRGYQAMFSTMRQLTLSQGTPARNVYVYNTLLPNKTSCLEMLTAAYYQGGVLYHAAGFFDSCNSRFAYTLIDITASAYAKYRQTISGVSIPYSGLTTTDEEVTMQIIQTALPPTNCWKGQILNVTNGAWDTLVTSCGTMDRPNTYGWSMFETYGYEQASSTNMCTALNPYHVVTQRNIRKYYDNIPPPGWVPVTMDDHALEFRDLQPCFSVFSWKFTENDGLPTGGDQWAVCDDQTILCDN